MHLIVMRSTNKVRNVRSPEVAKCDEGEEEDEEGQGIAKDLEKPTQLGDENFVLKDENRHTMKSRF